jgi:hypothetical protein
MGWLHLYTDRQSTHTFRFPRIMRETICMLKRCSYLLGLLLYAHHSAATPIVDQSYDHIAWGGGPAAALVYDFQSVGQSFTAGIDGLLTGVDVQLWHNDGFNEIQLSVLSVANSGIPDWTTPLATTSVSDIGTGFANLDYYTFDLSSTSLSLLQDQMYAFVLQPVNGGRFSARGGSHYADGQTFNGPGYLGGEAWLNDAPWARNGSDGRPYSVDLNFRTYVNGIPAPSTLFLLGLGLLGLRLNRQRAISRSQAPVHPTYPAGEIVIKRSGPFGGRLLLLIKPMNF